mgnify:CR=1 FL=1
MGYAEVLTLARRFSVSPASDVYIARSCPRASQQKPWATVRAGRLRTTMRQTLLLLILGFAIPACALQYVRKGTWRETWEASLAASEDLGVKLGPWYYIGPFDHTGGRGFDAVYPPEHEIVLEATYQGKGGRQVFWQPGHQFRDREINSLRVFEDNDWIAVYLHRTIRAECDLTLLASFGSDDGIKVWVNGRQVVAENANRACLPDQNRAALPLHAGDNDLLIKIVQGEGPRDSTLLLRTCCPPWGPGTAWAPSTIPVAGASTLSTPRNERST